MKARMLIITLVLMLCGWCIAEAETDVSQLSISEIKALIPKVHEQALKNANQTIWKGENRTTFSGWCGEYTKQQLKILGIGYVGNGNFTGSKVYYGLTDGAVTTSNYKQIKYKGTKCLSDIVAANNNEPVYNILVSQTNTKNSNGHVYFIYAIIDGVVYWSENSTWGGVKEGQMRTNSIASMQRPCQGSSYTIIGAVHFVKNDFKSVDSIERIAVSAKTKTDNTADDQCYIKSTPFEAGETVDVVAKDGIINITGAVENKHGNVWYKTEDGNYVYSGDVVVYEIDWTKLFDISAKFSYVTAVNSHLLPYVDSPIVSSIQKGRSLTVKKFVTNRYGNIWVQLSDNSFVCFHDTSKDETYMTFYAHVTQPTHSTTYPQGNITVSSSQGFWLKGPVKAEVPFLYLSTRIINRETAEDVTEAGSPVKVYPSANLRTFDIYETKVNGKSLDSQTLFRKLTAGWYQYELNVQFGFVYEGKTFKFGSEMNLVESGFTVNGPIGEEPLPDAGIIERLPGDANDDGLVNIYDTQIVLHYNAGESVTISTSNADVNVDGYVDDSDALLLLQYTAGWDVELK